MCLAVPMTLCSIEQDGSGLVELEGVRRRVRLDLVPAARVGDAVIVHAGYAIERLDREDADERLALFERLVRVASEELGEPVRLVKLPPDRS